MESLVTQKRAELEQQSKQQDTPPDILVASFFFHRRGDSLQRTTLGLFRSLLHQILLQDRELLSEFMSVTRFQQRCDNEGEVGVKWDWTASGLRENLNQCVLKYAEKRLILLYVDALDESGEATARDLMDYFHELRSDSTSGHLSICISCRPYPDVVWDWDHCVVVESGNAGDITTFLRAKLKVNSTDQSALEQIRDDIAKRASGVFQWVVLVTRRVRSLRGESVRSILTDIEKIPTELGDLYENMLDQLSDSDKTLALPLLRWITFAVRPLSLSELRYAAALDERKDIRSQVDFESSRYWCETDQQMIQRVLRLSQGLVSVLEDRGGDNRLQFDHESVQDYMSTRGIAFLEKSKQTFSPSEIVGSSHHHLTRVCICRLLADDVVQASVLDLTRWSQPITSLPFVRYATCHWMEHAQIAEARGISQADLIELSEWPSNSLWAIWSSMHEGGHLYTGRTTLQHVASRYGLCSVLARLIPMTYTPLNCDQWRQEATHPKDDFDRTPLSWAAACGHDEAARLLLRAEASLDSMGSNGRTPLMEAVINRRGSVVRTLLTAGANSSIKDSSGQLLLALAAKHDNEDQVRRLLARSDTIVDARDDTGRTALHEAVECKSATIVRLLLATGKADPDSRSANGSAPLILAAYYGQEVIAKLLLATGKVDVNARDKWNGTPLSSAAARGHEAIVKLLLETDKVDVNAGDAWNGTPLYHAALRGHEAVVKLLLETDKVDVNAGSNNLTPLSLAAAGGHEAVVKLLLETDKVDVNASDSWNETPLYHAALRGHEAVVKLLLETDKVDVNASDAWNGTPLLLAAARGHKAIVKLLLKTDKVDVNARNNRKETPLSLAAAEGHEAAVQLLLSSCKVDANLPNEDGRTPLWYAARWNEEGVVRLLLSCDKVDVHARDSEGFTALDIAKRFEQSKPSYGLHIYREMK
ncbi:hypothetical protein AC578_4468 [Pseudocercospora eumusae]|uniref:Nephrocystin 3-like N-terminal domain-containing protein n=1 Tax=Pseudocercospora eumusae TaxID=321146 RepID=A0A139HBN2_9PEZI|nr:hypothetical protein AC578_4468 [Pseudocercospora eumusae]